MTTFSEEVTKQIENSYGEYWEQLPKRTQLIALENFGWVPHKYTIKGGNDLSGAIKMDINDNGWTRPESLRGIEYFDEDFIELSKCSSIPITLQITQTKIK